MSFHFSQFTFCTIVSGIRRACISVITLTLNHTLTQATTFLGVFQFKKQRQILRQTKFNFQCAQNLPCELESLEITPHRLIQLLNRLNQKPSKQLILSKIKIQILSLSHELKLTPGIRLAYMHIYYSFNCCTLINYFLSHEICFYNNCSFALTSPLKILSLIIL